MGRILDVAENLLAGHGFGATSMRIITSEAGVNPAAVDYHSGSTDGRVQAVFAGRLMPVNEARLRRPRVIAGQNVEKGPSRPFCLPGSANGTCLGRFSTRRDQHMSGVGRAESGTYSA